MSIYIDDAVVEEIKDRVNIVDLITGYLPLEKSGANFVGLCPFHNEKTPSFTVSESKQFYHCFGCGESGDALEFVMKRDNLSFPEAIKILADKYGIELKETRPVDKKRIDARNKGYEINREVARFFLNNLDKNKDAQKYLEDRNINKKVSRQFGLGFAHDSWESLHNYLIGKGYDSEELEKLGLVAARSNGDGYYDRFRNRIIFPIIDTRSRVVGFGGRVLDDSMPKYLNSRETIVFNKGNTLYGLNMIDKYSDRENIILVEGYMDVIALFKNGIPYSVASLGTALTERQAALLGRYGKNVYICYDSDLAGINATSKAITLLIGEGIVPKVIMLGEYKDPDDFFEDNSKKEFEEKIKEALHFIDFKIHINKEKYNLEELEDKIKFTIEISKDLRLLKNPIEQDVYINKLSEELNISKEAIEKEVYRKDKRKTYTKSNSEASYDNYENYNDYGYDEQDYGPTEEMNIGNTTVLPAGSLAAEMEIIKLMIMDKKYYDLISKEDIISDFENKTTRKVLREIENIYFDEDFIDKKNFYGIMEGVSNLDTRILEFIINTDVTITSENTEKFIKDLINTLKINKIKSRRKVIRDKIKDLDQSEQIDIESTNDLLMELTELNEKLKKISYVDRG